jgi:hypothetical protein
LKDLQEDTRDSCKHRREASPDVWPNPARSIKNTEVSTAANVQPRFVSSLEPTLSQPGFRLTSDQRRSAQKTNPAIIAEVNKLERNIGLCLFNSTDRSRLRQREKDDNMMTFTDTVRLHPADNSSKDFTLVATVCYPVGRLISDRKKGPVEDLEELLRDRVFNGIKASN